MPATSVPRPANKGCWLRLRMRAAASKAAFNVAGWPLIKGGPGTSAALNAARALGQPLSVTVSWVSLTAIVKSSHSSPQNGQVTAVCVMSGEETETSFFSTALPVVSAGELNNEVPRARSPRPFTGVSTLAQALLGHYGTASLFAGSWLKS
jgi:hypothetical protein